MEVEWKFLANTRPDLEACVHRAIDLGWDAAPAGRVVLHDVYYDTPDRALLARGASVRRRTENGVQKVTVKEPVDARDGLFRREEWEKPAREVPADFFLKRGLIPTLHIHNTRRVFLLTKEETQVELALDMVTYRLGNRRAREFQVELELKQGGEDVLAALGEAAKSWPGLTPSTVSKYRRGMGLFDQK